MLHQAKAKMRNPVYSDDYQLTSSPILKKSLQQLAAAVYQRGNWIDSAIHEQAVRPPWSVACECPKLVKRLEQKCLCLAVPRGLDAVKQAVIQKVRKLRHNKPRVLQQRFLCV